MFAKHLKVALLLSTFLLTQQARKNARNLDVIGFVAKHSDFQAQFQDIQDQNETSYKALPFPLLRTICLVDFYDRDLVELARSRNVTVLSLESPGSSVVNDYQESIKWTQATTLQSLKRNLDGIVIRYQTPIDKNNASAIDALNRFMNVARLQTTKAKLILGFEAPYSPIDTKQLPVGNRNYDWKAIFGLVDRFIVTEYDQNLEYSPEDDDQGRCYAKADANLYLVIGGLLAYADLGVDLKKVTIILPLYGIDYQCVDYRENMRCEVEKDENGLCTNRKGDKTLLTGLTKPKYNGSLVKGDRNRKSNNGLEFWDEHSSTRYELYLENGHGLIHQLFHDGGDTLDLKINQATQFPIGGFGYWPINAYNQTFLAETTDNDGSNGIPISRRFL